MGPNVVVLHSFLNSRFLHFEGLSVPKGISFGLCDFALWFTLVCRILIYLSRGGDGNPLQYSCLGNPMNRGAWQATVYGAAESWSQLSDWRITTNLPIILIKSNIELYSVLPQWLSSKESACSAGAAGDTGRSLGQEDPLEESMVTHSSILPWRIPWAEEPGRFTIHRVTNSWTWLKWLSSNRTLFTISTKIRVKKKVNNLRESSVDL